MWANSPAVPGHLPWTQASHNGNLGSDDSQTVSLDPFAPVNTGILMGPLAFFTPPHITDPRDATHK